MKVHTVIAGYFKLDGGAMHGVVPKSMWQKVNPSDDNNMCSWAMRCVLIEHDGRLILVDNGMGDKQDAKFFSHFHPHGEDTIVTSLAKHGYTPADITDVFLTHLHFDHCGGSVKRDGDKLVTTFPNARYWSNKAHWDWALNPNIREKASFLKENIVIKVTMVDKVNKITMLVVVFRSNGFTPFSKMMYKIGKTKSVKKVANNNPPITTVANGR